MHDREEATMAAYSIEEEPSTHQSDLDTTAMRRNLPNIAPLRVQKQQTAPYHAHPDQQIMDNGPQAKASRLPVFQQVRSMLRKPPSERSGPLKYDEFSGNPSESGKAAHMQASAYKSPYQFEVDRRRSPSGRTNEAKSMRSLSPVSVLRMDEVEAQLPPLDNGNYDETSRPVSPVSAVSAVDDAPTPTYPHATSQSSIVHSLPPTPTPLPQIKVPRRKPVAPTTVVEQAPLPEPPRHYSRETSNDDPYDELDDEVAEIEGPEPQQSHFSWTTYTGSVPSVAHPSPDLQRHSHQSQGDVGPSSHFSWSSVATAMTHPQRPDSPPPSPPPPVPIKFKQPPPVQSILSRQRPVPRQDQANWTTTPPPPTPPTKAVTAMSGPGSATFTPPTSANRRAFTTTGFNSSTKRLPLPPELQTSTAASLSHLETLQKQEQDIVHQRKNIERLIREDEKIEKASPIEVSFAAVRDAKKRLEERKETLAEILLEERQIGIAISRARRRDGEEDGLWVRRVTG